MVLGCMIIEIQSLATCPTTKATCALTPLSWALFFLLLLCIAICSSSHYALQIVLTFQFHPHCSHPYQLAIDCCSSLYIALALETVVFLF